MATPSSGFPLIALESFLVPLVTPWAPFRYATDPVQLEWGGLIPLPPENQWYGDFGTQGRRVGG